jgi:hypothetical protein
MIVGTIIEASLYIGKARVNPVLPDSDFKARHFHCG